MHRFLLLLFLASLATAFICAILPDPQAISGRLPDYMLHGGTFAVLTLLGVLAFPRVDRALMWLALTLFGGVIEVVQGMPLFHRDADWHDWLVDMALAAVILAVLPPLYRRG